MRKSRLKSGDPMFVIKVEHFVTAAVFSRALGEYSYRYNEKFNPAITRTKAMEILQTELKNFGDQGEYNGSRLEGATDVIDEYNSCVNDAEAWVLKNYPYLKK